MGEEKPRIGACRCLSGSLRARLVESPVRCFVVRAAPRRLETLMDTQTVVATCEIILVVIGIVGLTMARRE